MADQQPGDAKPAAGEPDETRAASGTPSTADAPARWSGSAAVPHPGPEKSRNSRRAARLAREDTAVAPGLARCDESDEPDPTAVDPYDWASMPPVDPWADQDTPWDPYPLGGGPAPPPEPPMPPTRLDRPAPTRIDGPAAVPAPNASGPHAGASGQYPAGSALP